MKCDMTITHRFKLFLLRRALKHAEANIKFEGYVLMQARANEVHFQLLANRLRTQIKRTERGLNATSPANVINLNR